MVNELEKLTIIVLEENEITPETVEKNMGISNDFNNFELNNALGAIDLLKANTIVSPFSKNERDHLLVFRNVDLFFYGLTTILSKMLNPTTFCLDLPSISYKGFFRPILVCRKPS